MFLGRYQHAIDNKGRLTIPARYRDLLAADGAYVTQGFEDNLIVYTTPTFERIYQRVNQMSMTNPMSRILRRMMFSGAERVDVDRAGRILIPQFLREFARLEDQAVIVGAGGYLDLSPSL
jgi:MraZ protein